MRKRTQILGLVGWIVVSLAAGAIGGMASANAGSFYQQLDRPAWAPPSWLFGPVWSILYLLMGVAAWLVWRERGFKGARVALGLFLVQLIANALWTWIFFAWQDGLWAFMEIVALWLLILATMAAFLRISRPAGVLMMPYLVWVTYAAALTFAVWRGNPEVLG